MIRIQVPGSTSNLGCGFDSIGLAVERYLYLEVTESDHWLFEQHSANLKGMPEGKKNLIYQTCSAVARQSGKRLPECRVKAHSEIPLARGLGSSAAAIVAGIEMADQLLQLSLAKDEKFALACQFEEHGDNVAASVFGGLVVTGKAKGKPMALKANVPDLDLVLTVPEYELKTEDARSVLPETLPFRKAAAGSGTANLMVTAIMKNNWNLAGELMSEDIFHQPYRASLVPDLSKAEKSGREAGAYGLALSGAGPALIAFAPSGTGERIAAKMKDEFPKADVFVTRPAARGCFSHKKNPFTKQAL